MTIEQVNHINFSELTDPQDLKKAFDALLGLIEHQAGKNKELEKEIRELKDQLARLKGGNAKPVFNQKKNKSANISSRGREKGFFKSAVPTPKKGKTIIVDREIKIELNKNTLPPDAVFKGYRTYYQQDVTIARNNKRFLLATWHSASKNKTYTANFPEDEIRSHFGSGVRSLLSVLHHYGNVTFSGLSGLMSGFGIQISSGSISNLLKSEREWAVGEQVSILQAGLERGQSIQMDCTGNKQRGENKTTHIITNPLMSIFYTLDSKSRLDCLRALQGNPHGGISLMWHERMESDFRKAKVSKTDSRRVMELLSGYQNYCLSTDDFDNLIRTTAPDIYAKGRIMLQLKEVMGMCYYSTQKEFRPVDLLLTDDAPEYRKIAPSHGLCWVHDARYYNKISAALDKNTRKLECFLKKYWEFYDRLLRYKNLPEPAQVREKQGIEKAFDLLFNPSTRFGLLDNCIERTLSNKDQLLQVLDFPHIPLHNNDAELGARKIVRKRDISLHTWSDWGTELRDAFLSIIETARKLGISVYDYINDRITGHYKMPSLAQVISQYPV